MAVLTITIEIDTDEVDGADTLLLDESDKLGVTEAAFLDPMGTILSLAPYGEIVFELS